LADLSTSSGFAIALCDWGRKSPVSTYTPQGVSQGGVGVPGTEADGRASTKPDVLSGLDPKPGDLPMARLKLR